MSKQGRVHDILVGRDFTDAQLRCARSYQEGDVIHFDRAHKKHGIPKDSYVTVEAVDRAGYSLTVRTSDGERLELSPARWKNAQVYQWEHRDLAAGERIQFRIHDKKHKVANNEFATISILNLVMFSVHLMPEVCDWLPERKGGREHASGRPRAGLQYL